MFALTSTAFLSPTWGTLPNNNYGWGLIQINSALNSIPVGATPTPTATGTPPTPTNTATPSPTVCVSNYTISTATATIIPGVEDTGNHCDDCTSDVSFPSPSPSMAPNTTRARFRPTATCNLQGIAVEMACSAYPKLRSAPRSSCIRATCARGHAEPPRARGAASSRQLSAPLPTVHICSNGVPTCMAQTTPRTKRSSSTRTTPA